MLMIVLGSTENVMDKTKNNENIPTRQVTEVVLMPCNLVNNQYQQKSKMLYNFTPNKSYFYLQTVKPSNLLVLKTYKTLILMML